MQTEMLLPRLRDHNDIYEAARATMLNGQKIVVVMPAYNAARTLRKTYD